MAYVNFGTSHRLHHRRIPAVCSIASREVEDVSGARLLALARTLNVANAPHCGSHFVRRKRTGIYFEGWFVRLVRPESWSFSLMFSIEANGLGTIQVAGPDEVVHYHELRNDSDACAEDGSGVYRFCASRRNLLVRHNDDDGYGYLLTGSGCRGVAPWGTWDVRWRKLAAWGDRSGTQRCTATRLSRFPAFEPGWQVLLAHGVATGGSFNYNGKVYNMRGVRAYVEKNWGGAFPRRWWWVQANTFMKYNDLSVTAVGATRRVLGREETLGLIAIHLDGILFEFANWNSKMQWNVAWGCWHANCHSASGYRAIIKAFTCERGVDVRGPSIDGMVFNVRDAMCGTLHVTLIKPDGTILLDSIRCSDTQVEVGGEGWDDGSTWNVQVPIMPKPLRAFVNMIDANNACTT